MSSYLQEAKWSREGHVPSYEEYKEVGLSTGAGGYLIATTLLGMGEIADDDTYEWSMSAPKFIQALFTKMRLRDDRSTYKEEMNRGDVANGINCYIKQYGVPEEEASVEFENMINYTTKVMNEEFLKSATFLPLQILRPFFNFGRLADVMYKYGDGFTNSGGKTKDYITSLFETGCDLITL